MTQTALFADDRDDAPAADNARRASILVPYPVDRAYTYAVPPGLALAPGDYVTVPLGNREVPGVVWDDAADDVPAKKLKTVLARHDLPPMAEAHRRFIDWTAHYNIAPKGFVMKMAIPVPAALEPPKAATGYVLADVVQKVFAEDSLSPWGEGRGEGDIKHGGHKDSHATTDKAQALRADCTDAEQKLWFRLRDRQLDNLKFRRQHPVHPYIADFACLEKRLIVEIDGGQHGEQAEYDAARTRVLEDQGFRVVRFWNNEVFENIEGVLQRIAGEAARILSPSPRPSPQGEREKNRERFLQQFSPQRRRVFEVLSDGVPRRAAEIAEAAGCTAGVVKTLAAQELLRAVDMHGAAPCRLPDVKRARVALSAAQDLAARHMIARVEEGGYHAMLLDGVTGAGKTEVYFEAVAAALAQDRQVLILLPEIALSNAFLDRFRARFGCAPALWHSALAAGQRKTTWRGVATGETKVVVGARSALFLPYADLGLIVVDEEHDPAYKQEDGVIYHARDMAVVRAHIGKIPLVLISATPSLESMINAWAGRYEHLHLPDRHGGATLPDIRVIDMKADRPERQHFLSPVLAEALRRNLEKGEQSLLFLNRRGYAPLTLCRGCGHRMNCPRCTAWLVEHRQTGRMHCHHCAFSMKIPGACPECKAVDSFAACGPGVERIHEEAQKLFPEARTLVLASDTADNHEKLKAMLADIREHRVDIIIGTQIIAKGHHFPKLTLVGVVDADLGLQGGDLRAAERTYQLLHQVAGRAGREERPGTVYLQTYVPGNKVMQALTAQQRDVFYEIEAGERENARMPPFTRLCGIVVSGKDEKQVMEVAAALGRCAPQGEEINTLGPAEAPFYRLRGNYRRRLLVRAEKNVNLQKAIADWLACVKIPSTVRVYTDIDPQSFL